MTGWGAVLGRSLDVASNAFTGRFANARTVMSFFAVRVEAPPQSGVNQLDHRVQSSLAWHRRAKLLPASSGSEQQRA